MKEYNIVGCGMMDDVFSLDLMDVDIDITLLTGEHIEMTVKTGKIYATDWMSVSSIVIK